MKMRYIMLLASCLITTVIRPALPPTETLEPNKVLLQKIENESNADFELEISTDHQKKKMAIPKKSSVRVDFTIPMKFEAWARTSENVKNIFLTDTTNNKKYKLVIFEQKKPTSVMLAVSLRKAEMLLKQELLEYKVPSGDSKFRDYTIIITLTSSDLTQAEIDITASIK